MQMICTDNLNSHSQLRDDFGFGWSQFNESYIPPNGYQSIYNAFQYRDATSLQGSSFQGLFNTYEGSGYVYELRGKLDYLQRNLTLLQEMNWIDRQTRAVLAEFSVYNPNMNLIMVSTILVEFLPSGSILTLARFDPLNLFGELGGFISFKNISLLICMTFVVYFMIVQMRRLLNESFKEYFGDFWTIIEWSIIISAWISFVMFILRFIKANEVLDFFRRTQGYAYIKLQTVNDYNQILTFSLGLCSTFGSIKFLKLLRFNKSISLLGLTLKDCFGELVSFTVIFFIVWIAFVQIMYLVYGCDLAGYSSFTKSMETAFQVMLGKFDVSQMSSTILGPIIFSLYNIVVIYFALNIFISIIMESFEKLREKAMENPHDDFDFLTYAAVKVKSAFQKKKFVLPSQDKYKDHLSSFPRIVDSFVDYIYKVMKMKIV